MKRYKTLIALIFIYTHIYASSLKNNLEEQISLVNPSEFKIINLSNIDQKNDLNITSMSSSLNTTPISLNDEDETVIELPRNSKKNFLLEETKQKTTAYIYSSSKDDEIKATQKRLKAAGILTLIATCTAGAIQLKQLLQKDNMPVRRSLLSAGDVFGAGGVAQGIGGAIKGIALAIAAGGLVYGIRKYFGLIDARFEAQEEKAKAQTELALRQNNDTWTQRLSKALDQQQYAIEQNNAAWAKSIEIKLQKDKDGILKFNSILLQSMRDTTNAIEQEKKRNHKRLEPLVNGLSYITQILQESNISFESNETLSALEKNAQEAALLNNAENSLEEHNIQKNLDIAQKSLEEEGKKNTQIQPPALIPNINISTPDPIPKQKEKTCCNCCF